MQQIHKLVETRDFLVDDVEFERLRYLWKTLFWPFSKHVLKPRVVTDAVHIVFHSSSVEPGPIYKYLIITFLQSP